MKWWQFKKRDADLDRELRSDLELEEEEQQENGLLSKEARYAARHAFGNMAPIKENAHEAWGWTPFERLWQDVRFAFHQFSRSPRFACVCVIALALGIGAQTTIYSVVHVVLIDPYPYRGAMRMVHLHLYDKDPAPLDLALDGPQFVQFAKSPALDGAIAHDWYNMALTGGELPEQLQVGRMSPNAFDYFGVPVILGREFGSADGDRVAVLSYSFWKSHFAGRVSIIGQSLQLDHQSYAIIGVMPQRFAWMSSDVYVPLAYSSDPRRPANVYARIRPGVSDRLAEQALEPMLDAFAKQTPANFPQRFKLHLVHINEIAIGRFKGFLVVLFLSVSFLLVLACVNVAILLLARGETRQAEIAMRKALGAGRNRIVRQLLTEAVLQHHYKEKIEEMAVADPERKSVWPRKVAGKYLGNLQNVRQARDHNLYPGSGDCKQNYQAAPYQDLRANPDSEATVVGIMHRPMRCIKRDHGLHPQSRLREPDAMPSRSAIGRFSLVTHGLTSQHAGTVEMTAAAVRRKLCWMKLCGSRNRFKDDRQSHGPSRRVSPVSEFETANHNGPFVPRTETIVTSTRSPERSNQAALEGMRNRLKPIMGP